MAYLNQHQFLNQKKHGLISGRSTESALFHMTDTWLIAINDGNSVGYVLVDIAKSIT